MERNEWRQLVIADGYSMKNVFRDGDLIHKDAGPWTPTVHALLGHLEKKGFPAPRVYGSGYDDAGRETITYIEGEVKNFGPWSRAGAIELGRLLRRLHEATRDFLPPPSAVWHPWWGRDLGVSDKVIGHCDLGPWNIVSNGGVPVAIIDWELSGPVDPVWELAQVCWLNAKLHDEFVAEREGLPGGEVRAHHLKLIVDGYELEPASREGFVQRIIDAATLDAVAEADAAGIMPDTAPTNLADQVPWAIAWRARAAGWMIRNRAMLEEALR